MRRSNSARKPREQYEVVIESLDQEGRGVAHRDGKAVFVEGALPGETARYERFINKGRWEAGRVVSWTGESPIRCEAGCPNFGFGDGACGGCAMQHIDHSAQVACKQRVLEDALWHIGHLRAERLLPPISGPKWGYRHRARLSVRDVPKKGTVLVGFHERGSSFVADMTSCAILPERVSSLLVPMRSLVGSLTVHARLPQIEIALADNRLALVLRVLDPLTPGDVEKIEAFAREHDCDIWLQPKGPETVAPMHEEARDALRLALPEFGVSIAFSPTDFTQVNHEMNRAMVSRAVRLLGVEPQHHVADFFCGLGNFTLPLATRAARVIGIEGAETLVARARAGAQANGLGAKTEFVARNLFTWCPADWDALWEKMDGIDRILIDPPREGAFELAKTLACADRRPARIVYVSCNPATLARDADVLVHEGGWHLRAAGIMNMFPHTGHVESIAVFEPGPKPQAEVADGPGQEAASQA